MNRRTEEYIARILPYCCGISILSVAAWYAVLRTHNYWWIGMVVLAIVFCIRRLRFTGVLIMACISVLTVVHVDGYEQRRTVVPPLGQQSFTGTVVSLPDRRYSSQYITVRIDGYSRSYTRVRMDRHAAIRYGDRVLITGTNVVPESFTGSTGTVFDYPRYLAVRDIALETKQPVVQVIGYDPDSLVLARLYVVHRGMLDIVSNSLPVDARGLAMGMVLGDRSYLSDDESDMYRIAGLSHIIVLSGFNVTILADVLSRFGRIAMLRRRTVIVLSAVAIVLFVLLAGASVSLLRAGIMIGAVLLARMYYRQGSGWRGLLYAVVVMVLANPRLIVDDIGFELSVLATAGLLFLERPIRQYLSSVPERFGLREVVSTTLAATLATMPLVYFRMGSISGLGLIANILAVPLVSVIMIAVLVVMAVGSIWPMGGLILGIVPGLGISYIQYIAGLVQRYTPASVEYNIVYFIGTLLILLVVTWVLKITRRITG